MHGLYLLWWVQEKGMPAPLVATILAAGDLALVGFEVPTGWLADRFGHRASLIAGSFVQTVGMVLCWRGEGTAALVAASVLVALGDAFRSGADQALLYRSCQALGCEDDFQRIEARARAIQTAALVGLVIAGGAIVKTWGFDVGWAVETGLCIAGLAIAVAMAEPPAPVSDDRLSPSQGHATISWSLALLILPAALLGAAAGAASFLAQTAGQGDPESMTILVALITLAEAAGSALAARCSAVGIRGQAMLAVVGVVLVGAGVAFPATFLFVVVTLSFLTGVALPLRAAAIQRLAADTVRARAASVASACDMALSTIILPLAGFWRSTRSSRRASLAL